MEINNLHALEGFHRDYRETVAYEPLGCPATSMPGPAAPCRRRTAAVPWSRLVCVRALSGLSGSGSGSVSRSVPGWCLVRGCEWSAAQHLYLDLRPLFVLPALVPIMGRGLSRRRTLCRRSSVLHAMPPGVERLQEALIGVRRRPSVIERRW